MSFIYGQFSPKPKQNHGKDQNIVNVKIIYSFNQSAHLIALTTPLRFLKIFWCLLVWKVACANACNDLWLASLNDKMVDYTMLETLHHAKPMETLAGTWELHTPGPCINSSSELQVWAGRQARFQQSPFVEASPELVSYRYNGIQAHLARGAPTSAAGKH